MARDFREARAFPSTAAARGLEANGEPADAELRLFETGDFLREAEVFLSDSAEVRLVAFDREGPPFVEADPAERFEALRFAVADPAELLEERPFADVDPAEPLEERPFADVDPAEPLEERPFADVDPAELLEERRFTGVDPTGLLEELRFADAEPTELFEARRLSEADPLLRCAERLFADAGFLGLSEAPRGVDDAF